MADSTSHKVPKTGDKHKVTNMINRTTSESLRVGDSDKILNHPTNLSASTTAPKKKTSFQITSVTVGAHMSNDGGDDSADDLDESHTDDISDVIDISRVTDIETPSYSEDTFSKDDVFFNSSTSLGSAPVIPTSSQYGLAIVSPEGCGGILNNSLNCGNSLTSNDLHVSVTDNVINLGLVSGKHLDGEMRELHAHPGRNERFKVVKIESTEPFKRGRWVCMDYLDHTMIQQQQTQNNVVNTVRVLENPNDVVTVNQCTGTDSGISMSEHPNFNSLHDDQAPLPDQGISSVNKVLDQQNLPPHQSVNISSIQNSISPGQTMQFNPQQVQSVINSAQSQLGQQAQSLTAVGLSQNQQNLINANQHQSLQQQQMQQVINNSNLINQQQSSVSNQQQHQPMSQPLPQLQQGVHMQHIMPLQQNQTAPNMQQQQFQQQPTMHQPIQQPTLLHQPQQIQQHIAQPMQHPHPSTMPLQQQTVNQVPVTQPLIQNQQPIQQMPPATSQQLHQMQQGQSQHIQHPPLQQHSVPGVSCPQIPAQTSQPSQQVYHPASQPIIQPVMGTQPNLIPQQPTQYFTNTQPIQGATLPQAMPQPNTIQTQSQPSSSVNVSLQNYPITSVSQQQPQQIQVVHPSSMQHVPSSQIQMTPVTSLSMGSNLQIPSSQCTVLSPQTNQAASLVQQCYVSQPGAPPAVSSVAPTQIMGGSQALASSAVNIVPSTSILDNPAFTANTTSDQVTQPASVVESLTETTVTNEEGQPVEDAESASGTSAVAIDNKIEQAMDLVKSHLMFAVREEVEVLKEKIAELMDRINQLEVENTILKANASQETLAQLSTSIQPSLNNAP